MNILALNHAQITIPKNAEQAARAFYCDLLGLTEIAKPATLAHIGGFWLQTGNLQVHVGMEDAVDRPRTKAHLAYEVDDLTAWRAVLEQRGVKIEEQPPIPGYDRFLFRDPVWQSC